MRISLVVAASANNVIGRDGALPWHIPDDLRRFKQITMGHPIVMGRRTWESIGRPLPGRFNIVLSSDPDYIADGAVLVTSPAAALEAAGEADEVMIIGGGQVYSLFLPMAERIYLTRVDTTVDGDAYFPAPDPREWATVNSTFHAAAEPSAYDVRFDVLERRKPAADTG